MSFLRLPPLALIHSPRPAPPLATAVRSFGGSARAGKAAETPSALLRLDGSIGLGDLEAWRRCASCTFSRELLLCFGSGKAGCTFTEFSLFATRVFVFLLLFPLISARSGLQLSKECEQLCSWAWVPKGNEFLSKQEQNKHC